MYPPARTHARIAARDASSGVATSRRATECSSVRCRPVTTNVRFPTQNSSSSIVSRTGMWLSAWGSIAVPVRTLPRAQFKEIMRQVLLRMPDYRVDQEQIVEYPNWSGIGGWARIPRHVQPAVADSYDAGTTSGKGAITCAVRVDTQLCTGHALCHIQGPTSTCSTIWGSTRRIASTCRRGCGSRRAGEHWPAPKEPSRSTRRATTSVEMALPVAGDLALRTRNGLRRRVRMRWCARGGPSWYSSVV